MNDPQKYKFLKELKEEYHGSDDQVRRQNQDRMDGKNVQKGKNKGGLANASDAEEPRRCFIS